MSSTLPNLNSVLIAVVGVIGSVLSAFILRGQAKVHTLVNSNLQEVKDTVEELRIELAKVIRQRNTAQAKVANRRKDD